MAALHALFSNIDIKPKKKKRPPPQLMKSYKDFTTDDEIKSPPFKIPKKKKKKMEFEAEQNGVVSNEVITKSMDVAVSKKLTKLKIHKKKRELVAQQNGDISETEEIANTGVNNDSSTKLSHFKIPKKKRDSDPGQGTVLPNRPKGFVDNVQAIGESTLQVTTIPGFEAFIAKSYTKARPTFNATYYPTSALNSALLHLKHPSQIILCGHVWVEPVFGTVEVFGGRLTRPTMMFSSKDFSTYVMTTCPGKETVDVLKGRIQMYNLTPKDSERLLSSVTTNDVILLVKRATHPLLASQRYVNLNLKIVRDQSRIHAFTEITQCLVQPAEMCDFEKFEVPAQWDEIPLTMKTVVLGGKDAGKSSLCKFLVNRLLTKYPGVLYVEGDPGQGEFSPPGTVGAFYLTEPVLAPNFVHRRRPASLVYLGEVDMVRSSSEYLTTMQYILEKVSAVDFARVPWIVNTMGFCQGLGVHLNSNLIKFVRPTAVIQIQCASNKQNFRNHLTSSFVGLRDSRPYQFMLVRSVGRENKKKGAAREGRERLLFSYLSSVLQPPSYSFNDVVPYEVSLSEIYIGVRSEISAKDVLRAINCNLVALCEAPFAGVEIYESDSIRLALKPLQPCFGLGFVRAVDVEKKVLYLLTPVQVCIENVRMLVLGNIEVPSAMFSNQDGVEGVMPYMADVEKRSLATIQRVHRPPLTRVFNQ